MLIIISFQYHGLTGIYEKVHGLTREVDNAARAKLIKKHVQIDFSVATNIP